MADAPPPPAEEAEVPRSLAHPLGGSAANESLMGRVRTQLRFSPWVPIAGHADETELSDAESQPGRRSKRFRKDCACCLEKRTASYKYILVLSFSTLFTLMMAIIVVAESLISATGINELAASYENTTSVVATILVTSVLTSTITTASDKTIRLGEAFQEITLSGIERSLASNTHFIQAAGFPPNIAAPLGTPETQPLRTFWTLQETSQSPLNTVGFATLVQLFNNFTEAAYMDVAMRCSSLRCNATLGLAPNPEDDGPEPSRIPEDAPGNSLLRCFLDEDNPFNFSSLNVECYNFTNFSVWRQPPLLDQLGEARRHEEDGSSSLWLWWSLPYIFNGTIFDKPYLVLSASYPVALFPCAAYDCIEGVLWSTLTSSDVAQFCRSGLQIFESFNVLLRNVESETSEESGTLDVEDLLETTTPLNRDTAMYMVDRRRDASGVLLGGTFGSSFAIVSELVIPDRLELAANSEVLPINMSASFLQKTRGAFYEPGYDMPGYATFRRESLEPCFNHTEIERLLENGIDGAPDLLEDLNCSLVLYAPVMSAGISPFFETGQPMTLLLVTVLDFDVVLDPLRAEIKLLLASFAAAAERRAAYRATIVGVGVGVAIISIFLGILLSVLLSVRVTQPLKRLDEAIHRLETFDFREPKYAPAPLGSSLATQRSAHKSLLARRSRRAEMPQDEDADDDITIDPDDLSHVSEIARVELAFARLENVVRVFAKFVPKAVVKAIVEGLPQARRLHVRQRNVTIAFSDIKGFTSVSERLPVAELLFLLTRYLTIMTRVVEAYGGVVTEILGDGLLMLWNSPDDCHNHEAKACAAALAMQHATHRLATEFRSTLEAVGLPPLEIRVGINTGDVLTGNIGSETKFKFGCIGDAVNTASRLEGLCKLYGVGVCVSRATLAGVPERAGFLTRKLDVVAVKGRDAPTELFELHSMTGSAANNLVVGAESESSGLSKSSTPPEGGASALPSKATFGPIPAVRYGSALVEDHGAVQEATENWIKRARVYEQAFELFYRAEFREAKAKIGELRALEGADDLATDVLEERVDQELESKDADSSKVWDPVHRVEKF